MKKINKMLAFLLALVMLFSLTACGEKAKMPDTTENALTNTTNKNDENKSDGPKNASELIKKANKSMAELEKNYEMSMDMNFSLSMNIETNGAAVKMDMPIKMHMDTALTEKYIHGELSVDGKAETTVEYEGEKQTDSEDMSESAEFYLVIDDNEITSYAKTEEDDVWMMSHENEFLIPDVEAFMDEDVFEDAKLKETDDGYELSIKFSELLENEAFVDMLGEADLADLGDMEIDEMKTVFGNSKITYKFDDQYRLTEISTGEIDLDFASIIADSMSEEEAEMLDEDAIEASLELKITIDKYGKVDKDDVKVPDDIKENAIDMSQIEIEFPDEPLDPTTPTTQPSKPVDGKISDNWEDMDIAIDGVVYSYPYDYGKLHENGWFVEDEDYVVNKGESTYTTHDLFHNHFNPKDSYDAVMAYCGFKNLGNKAVSVNNCVVWSISFDILYGDRLVSVYPDVVIAKGIKWGSTEAEILAAFGEPDDTYTSSGDGYSYKNFDWTTDDYGKTMSLTVDSKLGLTSIEFKNFE